MTPVLAAEGGYQTFYLHGGEWADPDRLGRDRAARARVGFFFMRGVLAEDEGTAEDEGDREGDPRGRDGVPQAAVQDDPRDPRAARGDRVPHLHQGEDRRPQRRAESPRVVVREVGSVPHRRVRARLLHVRAHRIHRHEPRRARQRAHRGRGQAGIDAGGAAGRVPHRWCRRHVHRRPRPARRVAHHDRSRTRAPRSSSGSASAARCSRCSCGSAAASSPRRPTWAPTSSARSRRASPRTTRATPRRSPTTWVTTWATAPVWRPTSSSRTR